MIHHIADDPDEPLGTDEFRTLCGILVFHQHDAKGRDARHVGLFSAKLVSCETCQVIGRLTLEPEE